MTYYRGMNRQISARELQERAAEILEQNPEFSPVVVTATATATAITSDRETIRAATSERKPATSEKKNRKKPEICQNWWGKAWCKHLERFSYVSFGENPIKRGEKYVLNNAVVDLRIEEGHVTAHVVGDSAIPFEVTATIKPLPQEKIDEAVELASGKIQNIDALAAGDFPEDLPDILFPLGVDVDLNCTCPDHDYNYICPHIAAVLYGIGVRIDHDPLLLFKIRGIDVDKFIWRVVGSRVERMLKNANNDSDRILKGLDLAAKFGVDEADTEIFEVPVLEDCPFCGHNDYEWYEWIETAEPKGKNGRKKHGAYCKYCGAGLPLEDTMEDYARIWNHWKQTEIKHTNSSLRACPICGAFDVQRYNENNWFWHKCTECGCESGGAETRGEAVKNWNRRHSSPLVSATNH